MGLEGERIFELDPLGLGEAEHLFLERARDSGSTATMNGEVEACAGVSTDCPLRWSWPPPGRHRSYRRSSSRPWPSILNCSAVPETRTSALHPDRMVIWSYELLGEEEQLFFNRYRSSLVASPGMRPNPYVGHSGSTSRSGGVDASLLRRREGGDRNQLLDARAVRPVAADRLDDRGLTDDLRGGLAQSVVKDMPLGPEGRRVAGWWAAIEVENLRAAIEFAIATVDTNKAV